MTNGEIVDRVVEIAHKYTPTAKESLVRNLHMHKVPSDQIHALTDEQIKAIINDFVNLFAAQCCMDLAMYTRDFPASYCRHGSTNGLCGPCHVEEFEKR